MLQGLSLLKDTLSAVWRSRGVLLSVTVPFGIFILILSALQDRLAYSESPSFWIDIWEHRFVTEFSVGYFIALVVTVFGFRLPAAALGDRLGVRATVRFGLHAAWPIFVAVTALTLATFALSEVLRMGPVMAFGPFDPFNPVMDWIEAGAHILIALIATPIGIALLTTSYLRAHPHRGPDRTTSHPPPA